jgi:hypothetical protein
MEEGAGAKDGSSVLGNFIVGVSDFDSSPCCSSFVRTKPAAIVTTARNRRAHRIKNKARHMKGRLGKVISSSTVGGLERYLPVGLTVTRATPELWTTTKGGTGLGGDRVVVS